MEDCPELMLKKLCCTCLSVNRKLFLLCRVDDGVNNLYLLLSSDAEAYREGFYKDTATLFICFECKAIMRRISRFRSQACVALKNLTAIVEGRTDAKSMQCLSTLTAHYIPTLPFETVKSEPKDTDSFVDCGHDLDLDVDLDDVPLSDLQSYQETKQEVLEPNNIKQIKDVKEKKIKTRKVKKKMTEKYFTITKINEDEMIQWRQGRRLVDSYVEAKYKCEGCLEGFEILADFDRHNNVFHAKKPNHSRCDICHSYVITTALSDHRQSHYQKCNCQFCDYSCYVLSDMVKHLRTGHAVKSVWAKFQRQKTPQAKTQISKPRTKRILTDKKTSKGFKCPDCDKYFDNKNVRYKHIRRHHSEGFSCSVCGKRYPFKDNLIKHERLHEGPLPREECTICHKMIRIDLVRTHARIHSARETITCVECNKSYISRASYENHLKYSQAHASQDVLKYKCSMCDKGYRSKGELRDHVNYQHLGKTQHKCPVCGKALATRRCITRHVRRAHHDIKESPRDKICQQCGKAFRDKKGLREHEFIHTGERPLSCEICGCTFRQSASLYTHRKRVHKIYPQRKSVELVEPS
ncbi:hypothetical protein O3G_MSEX011661 [Manduca sexta]|uniref:C2H2-type domain-containing protein n=1 Tax=Manduca sexta TaxID=7130 RepID=A0A921ZKW0_MANSE|nr:hypothetical protein O3G_MSEX011661 [Manduca sexta]